LIYVSSGSGGNSSSDQMTQLFSCTRTICSLILEIPINNKRNLVTYTKDKKVFEITI
jgi:hypothetical protein